MRNNRLDRERSNNSSDCKQRDGITVLILARDMKRPIGFKNKITRAGDFFSTSSAIGDGRNVRTSWNWIFKDAAIFADFVDSFARFKMIVEIVFDINRGPVYRRNIVAILKTAGENAKQDADVECSL